MTQAHDNVVHLHHHQRSDPKGKPVSLFVTCIVDMIYPQIGMAAVDVLEKLGIHVDFPMAQTCCGQMGFNAGYRDEARNVARQFLKAFKDAEVIVSPSGSCISMVRHFYPQLFGADDPVLKAEMERIVSITWELSEYLVDGLGITDVDAALPNPTRIAIHDACHGLRMSNLKDQARLLLRNVKNVQLVELVGADQCCGFGGLFAVKMPDVSAAMLRDKVQHIDAADADLIVTGDASCLTQMNGGLSRSGSKHRVVHFAEVLAAKV
jgi:L-lactate dehydrogenase complex protein LldE